MKISTFYTFKKNSYRGNYWRKYRGKIIQNPWFMRLSLLSRSGKNCNIEVVIILGPGLLYQHPLDFYIKLLYKPDLRTCYTVWFVGQ